MTFHTSHDEFREEVTQKSALALGGTLGGPADVTAHTICPVCRCGETQYCLSARDRRKGLPGEWQFWECSACAVLFQHPMPTFRQLQAYYASYIDMDRPGIGILPSCGPRPLRRWLHALTGDVDPRDFLPARQGARVLDYGCGSAPYIAYFRSRGVNISGAEIAAPVVDAYRAQGFEVALIEQIERIPFPDDEFDLVYLMQVFEHIARPHEFLNEVNRTLKRGGGLYMAMPNAASVWRRVFGSNWVSGWFAPFHLFVYTITGITALAQAHGFKVVRSWSVTSDSWLRLNIAAALHPGSNTLDRRPRSWLDHTALRLPFALLLRLTETAVRQRDCLVVELRKC